MLDEISVGCNGRGLQHVPGTPVPVDEQFRMLKESGVFDHFDRMPQPGEEAEYIKASQKYSIPIRTGLWTYMAGRDEGLLEKNMCICKDAGAECHDIMLLAKNVDGAPVSDNEVVDFYLRSYEIGGKLGLTIGFEVHINMWSEDFRRVTPVAELVRAHGVPFNFVLDHSHILLKVENPEEQDISGIRSDVGSGRLVIDPYENGNVLDEWISQGMIVWLQVRPVSPNGPKNQGQLREGGGWGRACQYPFVKPRPEWFYPWHAYRVEPCKEVVRRVLRHHLSHRDVSPLGWITTDMIDMADYGGGVKYSIFDQNVAIAQWLRDTWACLKEEHSAIPSPLQTNR